MTDIVERLRSPEVFIDAGGMNSRVAHEAADEIERLRAALEKIADLAMSMCLNVNDMAQRQKDMAVEALRRTHE